MEMKNNTIEHMLGGNLVKKNRRKRTHLKSKLQGVNVSNKRQRRANRLENRAQVSDIHTSVITTAKLGVLDTLAFKNFQLAPLKQLCQAFGSLCHMSDEETKVKYKFSLNCNQHHAFPFQKKIH